MRETLLIVRTPAAARTFCVPAKLAVRISDDRIVESFWTDDLKLRSSARAALSATASAIEEQVAAYFARDLDIFSLPLQLQGTEFTIRIWRTVATIPFGVRASYGEVARVAGNPGAHRAVARAMGLVQFALFVPAHRVVGADGTVRGAGADSVRRALLAFEDAAR